MQHLPRFLIATMMLSSLTPLAFADQNSPQQVTIYTTSDIALQAVPADADVIYLDRQHQIESMLSQGLPANPHQAAMAMQQRMRGPEFAQLVQELRKASEGLLKAKTHKIQKLPAVTVDHAYVVYGQPNVAVALRQIQSARAKQ